MENFAVLQSNIENPYPMAFSFSPVFKKFYLQDVTIARANRKALLKTLFHFPHQVARLDLTGCHLGRLNYTLVRGHFAAANITGNTFTAATGAAINITADTLNISHNLIQV